MSRLVGNKGWKDAAEAAIAYYARGEDCPVESWKKSSTWLQVKQAYEELQREGLKKG